MGGPCEDRTSTSKLRTNPAGGRHRQKHCFCLTMTCSLDKSCSPSTKPGLRVAKRHVPERTPRQDGRVGSAISGELQLILVYFLGINNFSELQLTQFQQV